MRFCILACLCLIQMTAAWSQQATTYVDSIYAYPAFETQWLEISAQVAEDYLLNKSNTRKTIESGRLLDGICEHGPSWNGHFLKVQVRGFKAEVSYFPKHGHQVYRSHVNRDYRIQVMDSLGKIVKDADVFINKSRLRFNRRKSAHVAKQVFSKSIRVEVAGDTLLYPTRNGYYQGKLKKWYRVHARQFPLRPINYVVQRVGLPIRYVSRGIRYRSWRPRRYPGQRIVQRIQNPRPINGYALLSKPLYRHGDTLDVSVYAARYSGKPFKQDVLQFDVRSSFTSRRVTQLSLKQTSPGRYTARLPISKDFKLDQKFNLVAPLLNKGKRRVNIRANFKVEDYYLNEFSLDLAATDQVLPEKRTFVDIKAEDSNGLTIPDAEVEIVVNLKDVVRYRYQRSEHKFTLPDTLYHTRIPMEGKRERRVEIPANVFPDSIALSTVVSAQLHVPAQEGLRKQSDLIVDRYHKYPLKISMKRGKIIFQTTQGDTIRAILKTVDAKDDTTQVYISVPSILLHDPSVNQYVLSHDNQEKVLRVWNEKYYGKEVFHWANDTLVLNFESSARDSLTWQLYYGNELYRQGASDTRYVTFADYPQEKESLLTYRYFQAGHWRQLQHRIRPLQKPNPNALRVSIDQPTQVEPGADVEVELKVTDQHGRPAQGVRMSAATYNARFKEVPASQLTYLSKLKRKPKSPLDWKSVLFHNHKLPVKLDRDLVKLLRHDSHPLYALLYPDTSRSVAINLNEKPKTLLPTAYLTAYVSEHGKPQVAHGIYIDKRLTFWNYKYATSPYAVPVDTGWHEVTLVVPSGTLTRRLKFKEDQQLIVNALISDSDTLSTEGIKNDRWTFTPHKHISAEIYEEVLSRTFVIAKGGKDYSVEVINADSTIQRANLIRHKSTPVALVSSVLPVRVITSRADAELVPRSNHSYEMYPNQVVAVPWDKKERSYITSSIRNDHSFRRPTRSIPHEISGVRQKIRPLFEYSEFLSTENEGRFRFDFDPKDSVRRVLIDQPGAKDLRWVERPKSYYSKSQAFTAYAVLLNDKVYEFEINIPKDSLVVYRTIPEDAKYTGQYNEYNGKFGKAETPPKPIQIFGSSYPNYHIEGRVVDENGEPLLGAGIYVEGTSVGTATDVDGLFSLKVPQDYPEVKIKYVGYQSVSLLINGDSDFYDIEMDDQGIILSEVSVVAYKVDPMRVDETSQGMIVTGFARGAKKRSQNMNEELRLSAVDKSFDDLLGNTLRDNFSDAAAFIPDLVTDANGKAKFEIRFPDDITSWNTIAMGQDRKRRVGYTSAQTQAFLPFQAQLYVPRFLVQGDRAQLSGLTINRTAKVLDVEAQWFEAKELRASPSFTLESTELEKFEVTAEGTDSITVAYFATPTDSELKPDGERRKILVLPKGEKVTVGKKVPLTDPMPSNFFDPTHGPVTVRIPGNRVSQLKADVERIVNYPYGCGEQTASRLLGLLAQKQVELNSKDQQRIDRNIKKCIRRLNELQSPEGGISWWEGSSTVTMWVSLHAYTALAAAQNAGFDVSGLQKLRTFILQRTSSLNPTGKLNTYLILAESGYRFKNIELQELETSFELITINFLQWLRLQQLSELPIDTSHLYSLLKNRANGDAYFESNKDDRRKYWRPINQRLDNTLLGLKILHRVGDKENVDKVINYLLQLEGTSVRTGRYPTIGINTFESAKVINTLMPIISDYDQDFAPVRIVKTSRGQELELEHAPLKLSVGVDSLSQLSLKQTSGYPVMATVYQQFLSESDTLARANESFKIESALLDAKQRKTNLFKQGEKCILEVQVEVREEAPYTLIECPIPAGMEYLNRKEPRGPHAVHRAYERDRVAIFSDRLPVGVHTYQIALHPRFSGSYTLKGSRVELQYAPHVEAKSETSRVVIKP